MGALCLLIIAKVEAMPVLQGEPPSLGIIKQRKCGVVSSDFIRIKMAEAIPPDKGQLVSVGELS